MGVTKSVALTLPFEDLEETYDGGMNYSCPNEDYTIWKKFLTGKTFERAGGICSGGEIGLWAMLPHVTGELVLVDHSYNPLGFAMAKYLLIQKIGFARAKEVLRKLRSWSDLDAHLGKGWKGKLPLKARYRLEDSSHYSLQSCASISRYWEKSPGGRYPTSKLAKVRFIHGDFRHLTGQFDLFYASNAADGGNGNRVQVAQLIERLNELVKPGGLLLITHVSPVPPNWKELKRERDRSTGWNHVLYEVN